MTISLDLLWKIIYIVIFIVHIIFNIILIVMIKKKSSSDISMAVEGTKNVLGNAFKAIGINNLEDATKAIEQIKDLFKKE